MTDQVGNKEGIFTKEDSKVTETAKVDGQQQSQSVKSDQDYKAQSTIDYNEVFKDHLNNILSDGGEPKYKDVPTALAALKASQEYIRTLEDENRDYKESKVKSETMEEVLQRFTANKDNTKDSTKSSELDVEQLESKFDEWMNQKEKQKAYKTNQQVVSETLVKKFGDVEKGRKAFEDKAKELGLDLETFTSLASTSPKAVLSYFQMSTDSYKPNVQGSVNTDGLKPTAQQPNIGGVMFGATSEDMVAAWKAAGQAVQQQ